MPATILTTLFEHKAWCNRGLVAALAAAPGDTDRRQLALVLGTLDHASRVDRVFRAHLSGEAPGLAAVVADRRPELEALAAALAETDAWYLNYVAHVAPAELAEVVAFRFIDSGEPGRMTKGEMLAHVITHSAAHRGAIGRMLEALGVAAAPDMVTTFAREHASSSAAG